MNLCAILFVFVMPFGLKAQNLPNEAKTGLLLGLSYGYGLPGKDMAKRFGNHFQAAINLELIQDKYWFAGLESGFFFGGDVKEDVIANLKNADGDILGSNRAIAATYLRERGFQGNLYIGKLIPIGKQKGVQGIRINAGVGMIQHKVRILDEFSSLVQISQDYIKGYDRLTRGLMLHQSIGYQQLDLRKRLNFFALFDFYQGFTKGQRSYDYSTMQNQNGKRLDLLTDFRLGLILPFYFSQNTKEIYY
ncbi:MAG: hypothetical protein ABIV51_08800 [Saprospiraceae bacterium]